MKKTCMVVGTFIIFFMLMSQATAILSPQYSLKGALKPDTTVFFLGKTNIRGKSTGYPMERIVDSPLTRGIHMFPLFGKTSITNLQSIVIAEHIDITNVSSFEDLYLKYYDHITEYSNVTVTTENGSFILGIHQGTSQVSSELPYAVTTFLPVEIAPDSSARFLLVASLHPITMHCSGDFTVLTGFSNTSSIQVQDAQGTILWSGAANNTYLLFQQRTFSVIQEPPLFFFPLNINTSTESIDVSLTQADSQDISLERLIKDVPGSVQNFREYNTTEIVDTFAALDDFITATSLATNGAMLLLQTNDTLTIDSTTQQFSSVGFARFTSLGVTDTGPSDALNVQGECSLVFLGDHFYNPQAKNSSSGTAFPFELFFLWVVALCVFLSIHLFIKPDINKQRTNTMKRYAFALQFILLFLAILLLDNEVNNQFGISAFTALFTQGFSLITGMFILVELIIWVLGFILLALPIQILVNSGLRFFGFGKESKGIGRGIGFLSIWIFCGLYVLLIMNMIISLFHLNIVFPVG